MNTQFVEGDLDPFPIWLRLELGRHHFTLAKFPSSLHLRSPIDEPVCEPTALPIALPIALPNGGNMFACNLRNLGSKNSTF